VLTIEAARRIGFDEGRFHGVRLVADLGTLFITLWNSFGKDHPSEQPQAVVVKGKMFRDLRRDTFDERRKSLRSATDGQVQLRPFASPALVGFRLKDDLDIEILHVQRHNRLPLLHGNVAIRSERNADRFDKVCMAEFDREGIACSHIFILRGAARLKGTGRSPVRLRRGDWVRLAVLPYVNPMWLANWDVPQLAGVWEAVEEDVREARWRFPRVLEE
jgi:hypothetical protein